MNHIIKEQYQANWFVLPRPLILEYGAKIGTNGIALYALLAANCLGTDTGSTVQTYDVTAVLNLSLSEVLQALELLKDAKLIRYERQNTYTIKYELLFLPPSSFNERTGVAAGGPSSNTSSNINDVVDETGTKNTNAFFIKNGNTKDDINDDVVSSSAFQKLIQQRITGHGLADFFNDRKSLSFYLKCVRTIPEAEIRNMVEKVMRVPDRDIKTSRARYFTHLVSEYNEAIKDNNNSRY